jgi:hypothetical protein
MVYTRLDDDYWLCRPAVQRYFLLSAPYFDAESDTFRLKRVNPDVLRLEGLGRPSQL